MASVAVFGASSEVAMEICRVFAGNGFDVELIARRSSRLEPLRRDIEIRYKVNTKLVELDVLNFSNVDTYFSEGPEKFPEVACICFGYLGNDLQARREYDEFSQILQVNYISAAYVANHIARIYEARTNGCIIGVSSVAGDRGRGGNYVYGSAKAGFTAYLSGLRNSLFRRNVHVITVKPGFIDTKMTAHLKLPRLLTSSAEFVALEIFRAYKKKKNVVYISWYWRHIMFLIKAIPESIFKKLSV